MVNRNLMILIIKMAAITTVVFVVVLVTLLAPGVILSIPPGPNGQWIRGGQVTFLNAFVHACVIGAIVFYFAQ
jgi:hypothetical protein